jgi:hypothetical protein
MADTIKINRAPVFTLWGVIVAERLGYNHDEALTLGKAVAGLNAQSRDSAWASIRKLKRSWTKSVRETKERLAGEILMVEIVGRPVPTAQTKHGLRATVKGEEIDPQSVERYLETKFGTELDDVRNALEALAKAYPPQELERRAYALYEQFRPAIPEGMRGWGAAGELNLERIRELAKKG